MVEKEEASYDDASAVLVGAVETHLSTSVGAAMANLEEKLASKGISIQFPAGTYKSDMGTIDGKLLGLPTLIELAITHAIDTTEKATMHSVGMVLPVNKGSLEKTLVAGNVVALYECHSKGTFLRLEGAQVNFGGGPASADNLPFEWDSERFLVVNAGNGRVALYSPSHRRFLGLNNGNLSASGYPIFNANESPRVNETFKVDSIERNKFYLHCPIEKMKAPHALLLVQVYGFD